MAEPDNIVLEHLRAIRIDISGIKDDMRGLRAEMTSIRQHLAGVVTLQEFDHGDIATIKHRLDRIERRLELVD
ncbi:hypothetical protein [Methylobacterium aquaticum]|uniref:Uncharacterized protein n=1 Tax=Methylobacterium aquaticum TaxID=270351 RepID=A0A0J6S0D5_9HYPH|nr:hypothetical protein [Methylobacterium aquaticum]KMO27002.1 hypothetical protein VP06_32155 [Methylobacterium aquaticum]